MASKLTPRRFNNLRAWLSVGDLHRTKQYKLLMDFLKRARRALRRSLARRCPSCASWI